jgi:LysM repeat protein
LIIATFLFFSFPVQAGSLSASTNGEKKANGSSKYNSQTLPLLQAQVMPDVIAAQGGGDITVVQDSALIPETGPLGTPANSKGEDFSSDQIFNYVVRKGDTVAALSKMFGVSVNTILWANNLSRSQALKEGDILLILPVSGVRYTVQKGDTIQGIAKKFKADAKEIISFNELTKDSVLSVGDVIIIPDGEITAPVYAGTYTRPVRGAGGPDIDPRIFMVTMGLILGLLMVRFLSLRPPETCLLLMIMATMAVMVSMWS